MNLEKILRNGALFLALGLLVVISALWGAGTVALFFRERTAGAPRERLPPPRMDRFHEEVLLESFDRLSLEEAVALVGLLYTFRIVLVTQESAGARRSGPVEVPPLTLREAVETVSFVFGWDRRWLKSGFEECWRALRPSPLADRLACRIAAHPHVVRLEEVPELPGAA